MRLPSFFEEPIQYTLYNIHAEINPNIPVVDKVWHYLLNSSNLFLKLDIPRASCNEPQLENGGTIRLFQEQVVTNHNWRMVAQLWRHMQSLALAYRSSFS